MRTKRKMTVTIICILFAVLFACYGFWMSGNGSGTGFFLIWFVLAALLGGCADDYISGWMGKTSDVDVVDIKGNTAYICSFLCNYRRMHY